MIGQETLRKRLTELVEDNQFPRTLLLIGSAKSGKRTLATEITKKLGAHLIEVGSKVDEVREAIEIAYQQSEPTVYFIPRIDNLSLAAKNVLLKVTEEPPKKAYFIMTCYDSTAVLATLISRSQAFLMSPYKPKELQAYAEEHYDLLEGQSEIIASVCSTPGEVDLLVDYGVIDFINYVNNVVKSIGDATPANALKITTRLNLKDEEDKWDVSLFMQVFSSLSLAEYKKTCDPRYYKSIQATTTYKSQLSITSVMKLALVDGWLLTLQDIWG